MGGNVADDVPVHSVRIRVGRSIQGFGLSPGITKEQRVGVENLMKGAFAKFAGDLAGNYYPLTGMDDAVRQQLVDDHFLFMSGDPNLKVAGMERDWPEGRGIFHNEAKTFLVWVNEEDQLKSFPCKREVMYEVYSKDWPEVLRLYKTPSRLNPARTSNCPKSSVTFTLAQPILVLA